MEQQIHSLLSLAPLSMLTWVLDTSTERRTATTIQARQCNMGPKKAKTSPDRIQIKSQANKPRKKDFESQSRPNQIETTPTVNDSMTLGNRKLFRRFYEPLVLLYTLGQSRGQRSQSPAIDDQSCDGVSFSEVRRRFLRDLAYMCDYQKGGDTVTAIAVEDTPQSFICWVAANKDPRSKVESFLRKLLATLKCTGEAGEVTLANVIASKCITFAKPRIKAYKKFFENSLNDVRTILRKSGHVDGRHQPCLSSREVLIHIQ